MPHEVRHPTQRCRSGFLIAASQPIPDFSNRTSKSGRWRPHTTGQEWTFAHLPTTVRHLFHCGLTTPRQDSLLANLQFVFDDSALFKLLGPELGGRFDGVVELIDASRANEILMDADRRGLTDWIAVDDHRTVLEASSTDRRFIWCDPATGISNTEVQRQLSLRLKRKKSHSVCSGVLED